MSEPPKSVKDAVEYAERIPGVHIRSAEAVPPRLSTEARERILRWLLNPSDKEQA